MYRNRLQYESNNLEEIKDPDGILSLCMITEFCCLYIIDCQDFRSSDFNSIVVQV